MKQTATQFDDLAEVYEEFSRLPFRRELEFPSVMGSLGDISHLRILDMGCGSGVYVRELARRGAGQVTGLDESQGMVRYARARESRERLGVGYVAGGPPGEPAGGFDLVLGVYVLPYATTYEELVGLCRTAADALGPGGRFVTLPLHPEAHRDPEHYARYGFRLNVGKADGALADGDPVELRLCFGGHDISVAARHWSAATLEKALREAGFGPVRWHRHRLAPGAATAPPGFWEPYLCAPHAAILDTRKETVRS